MINEKPKKLLFTFCASLSLWLITSVNSHAIDMEKLGELHLHPYDIEAPKSMKVAKEFVLREKRLITCKTCHGIKGIMDMNYDDIDKKDNLFLIGGPYSKLNDFCYRCHEKEDYERPNIHKMIDKEGKLIKDNCTFCHRSRPDPEKVKSMDEVQFRLPVEKLCLGCHLKTPHMNALNHLKKPSEEMKKFMTKSEKKKNIILPLSEAGEISCITCHSPHEKSVVSKDKPAGTQVEDHDVAEGIEYVETEWGKVFAEDKKKRLEKYSKKEGKEFSLEYEKVTKEVLLRLPAKDGTLCLACHTFER